MTPSHAPEHLSLLVWIAAGGYTAFAIWLLHAARKRKRGSLTEQAEKLARRSRVRQGGKEEPTAGLRAGS
jgi:heme exporter protein D